MYHNKIKGREDLKLMLLIVGLRILTARKLAGLNQYQLSAKFSELFNVQVSFMKIHRWESGKYPINVLELLFLAKITGKPIDFFFKE